MNGTSQNIIETLLKQLKEIIPAAFTENKINISQLEQLLGENINTDSERYHLNWAGKNEAYKVLQTPTTGTIIPNIAESINWDTAENVFIEGENLEVLKVLQKAYYGKVKMIYIDPPYNTGNDSFIYPDKFSETKEEYLKRINEKNEDGFLMKEGAFRKNNKENGQFHSNWLNMMLPRLFLARNLLKDDGVIFISIDDNEVHNLRALCNEIFGEENFVAEFVWKKKQGGGNDSKNIIIEHEYILCFAKHIDYIKFDLDKTVTIRDTAYPNKDDKGQYGLVTLDKSSIQFSKSLVFEIKDKGGQTYMPRIIDGKQSCWRWGKEKVYKEFDNIIFKDGKVYTKYYKPEGFTPKSLLVEERFGRTGSGGISLKNLFEEFIFDYPKPVQLIKHFLQISSNSDDIILDFFAGSGTTAQAVMELNEEDGGHRKYICVQLPEKLEEDSEAGKAGYKTIADITQARIKKVIEKIQTQRDAKLPLEKKTSLGFRKYTLSSSNFKIWKSQFIENEEDALKLMELFDKAEKENPNSLNILWELLIKNGVPLTERISEIKFIDGAIIYHTADKRLAFILDGYSQEVQKKVLFLQPNTVICLDSLFTNQDNIKTNAHLKFQDNGIEFKTI